MIRGGYAVAIVLLAGLCVGRAQTPDYPARLVTIVAPSAPGGLYSLFARILADRFAQRLGQTFVVENRPGAASVLGAAAVARAPADGYTLMIASGATLAVNVTLHKALPYDPVADFTPIALIARVPEVLVVNPALPVRSLADLAALGKRAPLTFASAGTGTAQHLEGEMLSQALGLAMTHVPYRGALPALTDVVGGHVSLMFAPVTPALPMIAAGKLRPLGLAARARIAALPDVAPLADLGLPDFEAAGWFMLVAPAATPRAIVDRLHAEARAILGDLALRRQFEEEGLIPVDTPAPDALAVYVREQVVYWRDTLTRLGLAGTE